MFTITPLSIRAAIRYPLRYRSIRRARFECTALALSAAELSFDEHWGSVQAMLDAAVAEVQRLDQAGMEHAHDHR